MLTYASTGNERLLTCERLNYDTFDQVHYCS